MLTLNDFAGSIQEKPNLFVLVSYLLLLVSVIVKSTPLTFLFSILFLVTVTMFRRGYLAFYLAVFSLSFDQLFVSIGFSLKIHMIVFLATFLALVYGGIQSRKIPKLPPKILTMPLLLLLIFSAASYFFAVDKILTVRFLGALIYGFAVFTITYIFVDNKKRAVRTALALAGGLIVSSVVAIYQFVAYYFGIDFYRKINILNPGNFARPKGIFDHTNFLANFFLASLPIVISRELSEKTRSRIKTFLISIGIAALIITFSRAAYGAFIVSLAIIFYFVFREFQFATVVKKLMSMMLGTSIVVGFLLFIIGPLQPDFVPIGGVRGRSQEELLAERISSSIDLEAVTNLERLQIWTAGAHMLEDHWLTGIGLENFKIRYKDYKLPEAERTEVVAHNSYFQLLIETGVFGFLSFVWFWLVLVAMSLKRILESKDLVTKSLLIGALAALVGVSLQNLTNSVFYYAHTWFLYGFVAALARSDITKK
ncbi:MAG: hypothetical protein A2Z11_03285 [Candidatus Woykebacteria bacterium RBG_16_43_9]|uniref:O-antigen ligase-related domain-containing protein n=1 Tax=Candidatus Woykebacteria bacterium RBG_16_43_9 TaxID=1802596 RepID=A0A1G1WE31_9BACT|nr:MAG: hypothetical protein A2Z11_03285 [Candidatus Woykebacteria bacterium RBG_16_43_9]